MQHGKAVDASRSARRVEIVCHRGANEYAPENTYAAAQLCIEWGMDYVEIDVNRSADGVHFLLHGPELEMTTNGRGLITDLRAAEIDLLDAGAWFGPEFVGERVPRLDAFLRWIKGKAKVFLDIKDADLPWLVALLHELDFVQDCFVWAGNDNVLLELHRIAPEIAIKVNVASVADVVRAVDVLGASIVEVRLKDMSTVLVEACRARGVRMMIYHNRKEEGAFRQILRWGVELANVDHGDVFLRVMQTVEQKVAVGEVDVTPLPRAKRAIFVMLDGCRADALVHANTPTFDHMRDSGAWTLAAQAVMPSVTLPCHTSIFHSQMPDAHGIVSNEWRPSATLAPSLIAMVHDAGYETAAFYTWEELRDLAPAGKMDRSYYRRLSFEAFDELCVTAIDTIVRLQPTFSFVYLEAPDALGHLHGWMSPRYLAGVSQCDRMVGELMAQLDAHGLLDETLIMLMADHGGHGRGHGTDCAEDMTVPWVVWGAGVQVGEVTCAVSLIDVAPTLLYALGIPQPIEWRGAVIREVFA